MTKKILVAGFACLSVIAVAQSSGNANQTASTAKDVSTGHSSGKTAAPKDIASGQSSGKVASRPAGSSAALNSNDAASSDQVTAPRDMATGQSSGKRQYAPVTIRKVSDDDPSVAREQQSPKATGQAASGNKSANDDWTATTAKSSNPVSAGGQTRVAKGDVNGDGKADAAATVSSSSSSSSGANGQSRVAAADVNGDGKADAAINTSHSNIKNANDAASGQTSGKRAHQPATVTKVSDTTTPQK